jgi:hypothetical protein
VNRNCKGAESDRSLERARWVTKYRASGLGLKQFAEQHGLKAGQLHYWVYESAKLPETRAVLPAFQEVRLPIPRVSAGSWSTEISLPNGTTVRLTQGADVSWAIALIDGLR